MSYRIPHTAFLVIFLITAVPMGMDTAEAEQSEEPDEGGYRYTDSSPPHPVIDSDYIVLKGDPDAMGWDTSSTTALISVSLPFGFKYYGKYYSTVHISQYGAFSFVEKTGTTYRNIWDYSIPSIDSPQGIIAPYWSTDDDCYSTNRDMIFTMETTIDGEEVFIIEWNTRNNNNQFQAVLHMGGLITFQYSALTGPWGNPIGSGVIIGIEKPDGSTGIEYQAYQWVSVDIFVPPFAIAFHAKEVHLEETALLNGYGPGGDIIYAGSEPYVFRAVVSHSDDRDSVRVVSAYISPFIEKVKLICYPKNRTFKQLTGSRIAELNLERSSVEVIDRNRWQIDFALDFNITYPSEKPRNVSFKAAGDLALPDNLDAGRIYRVENDLEWSEGEVHCFDSDGKRIYSNDYVAGGSPISFANKRIVYEDSDIQPSPAIVQVNVSDNWDNKVTTYIHQGRSLNIKWPTIRDTAQMQIDFSMVGISIFNMASSPSFSFQVRTDVDLPDTIPSVVMYPDVFGENASNIDNDRSVHVGWGRSEDGSSGIGSYIVRAEGTDYRCKEIVPGSINGLQLGIKAGSELPEGEVNISVTPVDAVGNIGFPAWTLIYIDLSGPSFQIIDPPPGSWAVGTNPEITVRAVDVQSTVNGPSLQYRYSRDNGTTWGEWRDCSVYSTVLSEVEFVIRPHLPEGTDGLVQFRGEDMIGSGISTSDPMRVIVDANRPNIRTAFPAIGSNQTTESWLPVSSPPIKILIDDGSGSGIDRDSITYSVSTDGGGIFSVEVPVRAIIEKLEGGLPVYSFTTGIRWPEGDSNILRVTAYDNAGRKAVEEFRIRIDTTPVVEILKPSSPGTYPGNRTVEFLMNAFDRDGDPLNIRWISNIDGLIGTGVRFSRLLTPGEHVITVIVSDDVHSVRSIFRIMVRDVLGEDVNSIDSDGDGMSDGYELKYGLDIRSDDSLLDPDGDNFTNLQEFISGTNPLLGSSFPGSSVTEDKMEAAPIAVFIAGLLLLVLLSLLMIREARKEPALPLNPPPIVR
ncbi:MAG: hypothetical protein ACMUIG_06370 [Thermoplasmatota archaeon]